MRSSFIFCTFVPVKIVAFDVRLGSNLGFFSNKLPLSFFLTGDVNTEQITSPEELGRNLLLVKSLFKIKTETDERVVVTDLWRYESLQVMAKFLIILQ